MLLPPKGLVLVGFGGGHFFWFFRGFSFFSNLESLIRPLDLPVLPLGLAIALEVGNLLLEGVWDRSEWFYKFSCA